MPASGVGSLIMFSGIDEGLLNRGGAQSHSVKT
jgi:hypothetical protein